MVDRLFCWLLGTVAVLGGAAAGIAITLTHPARATNGQIALVYGSLFFVGAAVCTAIVFFVVKRRDVVRAAAMRRSLRQGATLAGLLVFALFLQAEGVLSLWVLTLLVAAVVFAEWLVGQWNHERS